MIKPERDSLTRHLLIGLALALFIYAAAFSLFQYWRNHQGGWQVTFSTDRAGVPTLQIAQPRLGLADVRFTFPGQRLSETSLSNTIVFDQPITNVPFGRVVYLDTTFLPGAIVFDLFGHEIQLLPRVLVLDHQEVPWQSGHSFDLPARTTN